MLTDYFQSVNRQKPKTPNAPAFHLQKPRQDDSNSCLILSQPKTHYSQTKIGRTNPLGSVKEEIKQRKASILQARRNLLQKQRVW